MKSYTDTSQSKRLAEILPLDSADMYYHFNSNAVKDYFNDIPNFIQLYNHFVLFYADIPCWSLAALLDVLPKNVKSPFGEVNPFVGQVNTKDYRCVYLDGDWDSNIQTFAKNPIDACYKMILKLHEQKLL